MSGIFGALDINDTDRVYLSTLGQSVIYDAIQALLTAYNAELTQAIAMFVEETTEDHTQRYKLPGTGRLQKTGDEAPTGAVRENGQWDVAFPLEGYGAALAGNRIDMSYMTVQDLDKHLDTVFAMDANTVRFALLQALLNKTNATFADKLWGNLTVKRLANADSDVYPPVLGTETETTSHQHYNGTNYTEASISDTNDPYITLRDNLEEHFGNPTGGSPIVALINNSSTLKTLALTKFDPVPDRFVLPQANKEYAQLQGIPDVPGRLLGRHSSGVWVVEWRWIPSAYILGVHMAAPKPLKQRVDPGFTGLPRGLTMVAKDEDYPISTAYYDHRFGYGVGNRLSACAYQLVASTTYTTPTGY